MKASFENSVSVLVRAYMNDTLEHCECNACAVGNLVAAAKGVHPKDGESGSWFEAIPGDGTVDWEWYRGETRKEMTLIGYKPKEVARIEKAFEGTYKSDDTDVFDGLIAVVEVLAEIHGIDLSTKEAAIGQFKEVQLSKA